MKLLEHNLGKNQPHIFVIDEFWQLYFCCFFSGNDLLRAQNAQKTNKNNSKNKVRQNPSEVQKKGFQTKGSPTTRALMQNECIQIEIKVSIFLGLPLFVTTGKSRDQVAQSDTGSKSARL